MNDPWTPFQYPIGKHVCRHGPVGYADPQRYKPWLRDEFHFRCVYCLCRERWVPDGEDAFSVEHYHSPNLTEFRRGIFEILRALQLLREPA